MLGPAVAGLDVLSSAAATGSALIGLYIGAQAYRGLRRHDEPAMRYLSAGTILLFGVTYALVVAGQGLVALGLVTVGFQELHRASGGAPRSG
jgi:hypothetical protein